MKHKSTLFLTQAAMIGALYVVLTLLANALGLASMQVQVRFSEALTILPYFTPAAVPGVFVGCLLSNVLAGGALIDIMFGSLTTFAAAVVTYLLRRYKWLAPIPPIVFNTLVIPFILKAAYGIVPLWLSFITVCAGEIVSAGALGMLLLFTLQKYRMQLFTDFSQYK